MKQIEKYQLKAPKRLHTDIAKLLFHDVDAGEYYEPYIELLIKISEDNLNIKEFSSYLDIIYRVDGMMSESGYNKYVHNRNRQIEITKIKFGSVELIIERLLNPTDADKLVVIWLVLKYLPQVTNSITDSIGKLADVLVKREEYLEKKDRRKFRKQIRELISEEVELTPLDKREKEKLVDLLDEAYVKNRRRLASASRFAKEFVQSVQLLIKEKNSH